MSSANSVWRTGPVEIEKPRSPLWVALGILAALLVVGLCGYGLTLVCGFRSYKLACASMEKTLYEGDTFVCNLNAYRKRPPARGDVIVFEHGEYFLVKRLIGLEGDRIEGRNGVVSVNGKVLDEPYAEHTGSSIDALDSFGPVVVAPGTVFLLGDNRDHSLDSRLEEFGEVRRGDIRGKAVFILSSSHGQAGQSVR